MPNTGTPESAPDQPIQQAPAPPKQWKVGFTIRVEIPVDLADAAMPEQAVQFARELSAKLPLKVTLGDVPLVAKFLK